MRIEVKGLENTYFYVKQLPAKLDKALSKGNKRFMQDLRAETKFTAPRSLGNLSKGISIDNTKEKGKTQQWKLVCNSPYTLFVIEGREPNKTPPPWQELLTWNKLSATKAGQYNKAGAAFILAKHIGIHGTKANNFPDRAFKHTIRHFDKRISDALDEELR